MLEQHAGTAGAPGLAHRRFYPGTLHCDNVRVMSFNVNGIRAAYRKGLIDLVAATQPDLICLQEVKAQESDIPALLPAYSSTWHCAARKGYSGVGILSLHPADRVVCGLGVESYDSEGRVLRADFGDLSVLNVYVPSGSSRSDRQDFKMRFLTDFYSHVRALLAEGRELIVCGDLNIAHQKIDLKNWRSNQTTSGFLPEERLWFGKLLELGLVDVVRAHVGLATSIYSWWSLRSGARMRNVGWRLDYQLSTPGLASKVSHAEIPREPFLSDHAPIIVDYRVEG